jgi:hypothetical protein
MFASATGPGWTVSLAATQTDKADGAWDLGCHSGCIIRRVIGLVAVPIPAQPGEPPGIDRRGVHVRVQILELARRLSLYTKIFNYRYQRPN